MRRLARSQAIGGMIFVSAAFEEGMTLDSRFGSFVNHDLEYLVPVMPMCPMWMLFIRS